MGGHQPAPPAPTHPRRRPHLVSIREDGRQRTRPSQRILGLLLLAMAAGQLAHPAGFADIVASYRLSSPAFAVIIAGTLVAAEVVAGAGLFSSVAAHRRRAAAIALVTTVAWTVLGVQAFLRGLALDNCGCFGVYVPQPLRWWVLVEDVEFVALAAWVRRGTGLGSPLRRSGRSAPMPTSTSSGRPPAPLTTGFSHSPTGFPPDLVVQRGHVEWAVQFRRAPW